MICASRPRVRSKSLEQGEMNTVGFWRFGIFSFEEGNKEGDGFSRCSRHAAVTATPPSTGGGDADSGENFSFQAARRSFPLLPSFLLSHFVPAFLPSFFLRVLSSFVSTLLSFPEIEETHLARIGGATWQRTSQKRQAIAVTALLKSREVASEDNREGGR